MQDQPRFEPLERATFFADRRSARPLVAGTVARGELQLDAPFWTGRRDGQEVTAFPVEITLPLLARGRERYGIFCAPCHGGLGAGDGMVVRRGYSRPPSLHLDRLRQATPGYLYGVIAQGFGRMPSYAAQVPVEDRWAIVAYLRALQLSQRAPLADLAPAERSRLEEAGR